MELQLLATERRLNLYRRSKGIGGKKKKTEKCDIMIVNRRSYPNREWSIGSSDANLRIENSFLDLVK